MDSEQVKKIKCLEGDVEKLNEALIEAWRTRDEALSVLQKMQETHPHLKYGIPEVVNEKPKPEMCPGYGKREGDCENDAGSPYSKKYCIDCDNLRLDNEDKDLEKAIERNDYGQ